MAKVFQYLLLTGNSFRLLVFGTNLIASVASASLIAVPRHSLAGSPLFGRSLDVRFAIAAATVLGELVLSPPPSLSLQPPASSLASASSPSPPQACHHSHRRHSGLLALSSILQASIFSLAARPTPLLAIYLEACYSLPTHISSLSLSLSLSLTAGMLSLSQQEWRGSCLP